MSTRCSTLFRSLHRGHSVNLCASSSCIPLHTITSTIKLSKYGKSGGRGLLSRDDDDEQQQELRDDDNTDTDNSRKTLMTDIIKQYNEEYGSLADNKSIISAAQSIPNFQHLYIVQLMNPLSAGNKINIIGVRKESITEQDAVATEIRKLLHLIKPRTLIVQLSKDRYEHHLQHMDMEDLDSLIPNTWSLTTLLSQQYIINSARIALHLINYVVMDYKMRMNPYLFALLYADNEANGCEFVEEIVLGDMHYDPHRLHKINHTMFNQDIYKYIASTTREQRKKYGAYPGVSELLFGINSVHGVSEWLHLNKKSIRVKEKDVYQFAVDMQSKLEFSKEILESSAKSMAYYTYRAAEQQQGEEKQNIMVLCNIFTMLSIPMYFGKVSKEEIAKLCKSNQSKQAQLASTAKYVYKRWLFNYWNAVWWTFCAMHTVQTGIDNLDYPYLLQCGVLMPLIYPACYVAISFRARHRVRKMQKLVIEEKRKHEQLMQKMQERQHHKIKLDHSPP